MNAEKNYQGAWVVSDIIDGYREQKVYFGYTKKEAIQEFKKTFRSGVIVEKRRKNPTSSNVKVLGIYYDKKSIDDEYTIVFDFVERKVPKLYSCLCMCSKGSYYHSSCQRGKHLGKKITFSQLPEDCKKTVKKLYDIVG